MVIAVTILHIFVYRTFSF